MSSKDKSPKSTTSSSTSHTNSNKDLIKLPKLSYCVSSILKEIVNQNSDAPFNESDPFSTENVSKIDLEYYIDRIKKYTEIEDSSLILAIIYSDRLCAKTGIILQPHNIHRIILCCILIAIKYNEDSFYANDYYAKVGGVSLKELNYLEYYFLEMIEFDLYINSELVDKYTESFGTYAKGKKCNKK